MKIKWAIFAALVVFFFSAMSSNSVAVNTSDIDRVRTKAVLDSMDKEIIDTFLAEAVRELLRTRDFTSIAKARTVILSRQSTQGQYAEQFSASAREHIQAGFEQAQTLRPDERKTNVAINLLILIDGLQDPRLTDLAMDMLKDEHMVVRYWAVHSVTNPALIQKLNSGPSSNTATLRTIAEQLKELVDTSSPEIIRLIARFAANVDIPQGEQLLLQIADMRIARYADWTVSYELLDIAILKLLESKIPLPYEGPGGLEPRTTRSKPGIARCFAQLYSYAIQRYIKGPGILTEKQRQHLASVLVEIEQKCISRLLGRQQLGIRRALERESMTALLEEHNRLLGDGTTAGELPSKLSFTYGSDNDGERNSPLPLPDPPQKPVNNN